MKRRLVKIVVFVVALLPAAWLLRGLLIGDLGVNPAETIQLQTGRWALKFLLITLAVTPVRRIFHWNVVIQYRRMLGLFAFFYATLHFSVWLVLDHFFAWRQMGADIVKRPYITVGMAALVLMIPLAATSTAAAIRRMGGARWQWLHRVVYVIGVCAVLHYLWLAKKANPSPYYYAVVLGLLLTIRVGDWVRRAVTRTRVRAAGPSPRPSPQRGEGA